jgi:acylphosphatase
MTSGDIKTFTVHITGKVQGVWYRASAKDKALSLGLKGKVWNNPDDSVGAVVQGPEENVKQFIEWCKEGPRLASVDEVRFEETVSEFQFEGFDITRR